MSQRPPLSILVVNAQAEEVKLATIGFRGFFPGCRIDVAYSAQDARMLASAQPPEWALILLDDGCLSDDAMLIDDLKHRTFHTAVLLQSDKSDDDAAVRAVQARADYFLAKQSPAFLTELLFCAREAVAKRDLRLAVEHATVRHRQLLDSLTDGCYELDPEGCFVVVSPSLASWLRYAPEELIGHPYTKIVPPDQQAVARFRFNDRRSGARSTRRLGLVLQGKPAADGSASPLSAEVTARGLYDSHRRFLGTIGIIRDLSAVPGGEFARQESLWSDRLRALTGQWMTLVQSLQQPLSSLRTDAQQLFLTVRESRLQTRLEQLAAQASTVSDLGHELVRTIEAASQTGLAETLNDLLREALASSTDPQGIIARFSSDLPPFSGDRNQALTFFRRLIDCARAYLALVGRHRHVFLTTKLAGPSPSTGLREVEIELVESDREIPGEILPDHSREPADFGRLHRLLRPFGGRLDVSAPASGPLQLIAHIPSPSVTPVTEQPPPIPQPAAPPLGAVEGDASVVPVVRPTVPAETSVKERRAHPRISTTLHARIGFDSTVWDGTIANLSLGGACLSVAGDFPAIVQQDVQVIFRTAVGTLELSGTAHVRFPPSAVQQPGTSLSHVIIVFKAPSLTETAILASMIDAARERSVGFSLEITLQGGSLQRAVADLTGPHEEVLEHDRRESVRVAVTLPVRLAGDQEEDRADSLMAQTLDISRSGACLLVRGSPDQLQESVVLHFAPVQHAHYPSPHEPGVPDAELPARIIWTAQAPKSPSVWQPDDSSPTTRTGVRFHSLTPYAERELCRLIRQHLSSQQERESPSDQPRIVSVHRECRNQRGHAIAILDDHAADASVPPDIPVAIISPGFGQTATDYASFSYYLARHHLRVLRYDHTNHVGLSEGELQNLSLRGLQTDLAKVVEFVRHTWPTARVVVLASDLAARAAMKTAVDHHIDLLVLVNPVVDVGAQLADVHGHDLISDYRFGLRRGVGNLFGLNVNIDQFVADVVAGRFPDLASTLEDARLLRSPLCLVTSPAPESISLAPADLPHAFMTAIDTRTRVLSIPFPLTTQDLPAQEDHPASFRQVLDQIASALQYTLPARRPDSYFRKDLMRQRRLESEHLRLRHDISQIGREALALAHGQQLQQLANVHEYRKLLDDLYAFLSPLDPGMTVLEAGIGQSDVARALLVNHAYRTRQRGYSSPRTPLLIGMRRSPERIRQARRSVLGLQHELVAGAGGGISGVPWLRFGWVQGDWTEEVPIPVRSIDRIVSNLSLSFVASPQQTLREWARILHPNGRLVFTTFHPSTGLSVLYRHHLRLANHDEFETHAQQVLHYLGRLREAICHGILHTFDPASLASLLRQTGHPIFRIRTILDGQALVAIVGNSNSSGPG